MEPPFRAPLHPWWENYGWAALNLTACHLWWIAATRKRYDLLPALQMLSLMTSVGAGLAMRRNQLLEAGIA